MRKCLKKDLSVLMVGALMVTSIVGFNINSFAASNSSECLASDDSNYHVYNVSTEEELKNALLWANSGDYIQLSSDIRVSGNLEVANSVTIDLDNHSLMFAGSVRGLVIDSGYLNRVCVYNGCICGDIDSDAAVYVQSGDLRVYNCSIYAGNCYRHNILYYGNALCCASKSSTITLEEVYLQGGNGYSKGIINPSRTGKAIYFSCAGSELLSLGKGYTVLNGQCK